MEVVPQLAFLNGRMKAPNGAQEVHGRPQVEQREEKVNALTVENETTIGHGRINCMHQNTYTYIANMNFMF